MHSLKQYSFVTTWKLKAPLADVWNSIRHSTEWPQWWKGVLEVHERIPGDEHGNGTVSDSAWRSILPYTLRFRSHVTAMKPMAYMEGHTEGDLKGKGRWYFSHENGITIVRYEWEVETTSAWMNFFAPILKPIFKWNHDVIMRRGGEGLARKLQTQLIS